MRLSGIKLAGFKSFVDPTQLPLPANLTGVVGPNGCGKSNIIDAVRWVLGEASMKQLRGQDSDDVIFNGSKSRKPVGRASVELTFDNSDGQITGPYAAYTEIAVRRELTRDGNSQYFLNGRKCLKRDITDLFLGTGLGGKNQYAIIEQGMVSRMIEAKPEQLRDQLEEAAGISKYKERRRETESRIKQTRENLSRLNDLRSEIQQRLEVLRKQAANAEKYKEFKEQERTVKAEMLALRERQLAAQSEQHELGIETLAQQAETARGAVGESELARGASEQRLRELQEALSLEQSKVFEADGLLARQEQSLAHARELKTLKLRELEQLVRQLAELERRSQQEQQRLEALTGELAGLDSQSETAQRNEQEAVAGLARAEEELQAEQLRWDQFQQRSEQPLFQTEGERVRVQGLERAQLQIDERHKRLAAEQSTLDATPIQASLFDADAELERLNADIEASQTRLAVLDRELPGLREQRSALESGLHETRQALQSARGRSASLETLQQAALRQDDAELSAWLRQRQLHELPRLAQALRVSQGWEAAVEHVLQGLLQAPLLPALSQRSAQFDNPPKAGTALLDAAEGNDPVAEDSLAAQVGGPLAVRDFLATVYCAADARAADARLASLLPGESVITPDGSWRGQGWLRFPRTEAGGGGVIAREALLKQLKLQIDEHSRLVEDGEQQLSGLRNRQQQLEGERRELAQRFEQIRSRHASRMAFRQAQAVRLEQTQARIDALIQDIEALQTQREQQLAELAASREKLVSLEAIAQQLREERNQLQQSLARARDAVSRARATLAQAGQAKNQLQVQLAGRQSALAALQRVIHDLGENHELLVHQRGGREKEALELDSPLQSQAEDVEAARSAVAAARENLRIAREALTAAEQQLALSAQQVRQAENAKDAAGERLQQARLEFENLRARREAIAQQITETGLEREALFAGLPIDATAEAWEEKLASVLRRIDRLGAINLAAIQELEEAEGREKYLGEQYADLHGALETLEGAIRQIDAETKERFKATFDQVDTIFRERFPKLFGGGEAYLELTGDDLLDTGVRVMARPPGKRNSSIQMLSGGEKAMTAVALLLALFQLNPAPFCLMDEVDAPLDDANVGRYCEVVREMSENVQFIIITHNKITMELAAYLHGVTMQEPGVSRLVSVDVQQAVELAGKPETKAEA